MPEPFKNLFNEKFFTGFCSVVELYVTPFDSKKFMAEIFDADWGDRKLKERARHTTIVLKNNLYGDYEKNIEVILNIINYIQNSSDMKAGIESMFFPDFIEYYGLDQYDLSIAAIEKITQYFSCEFAIRCFIMKYPEKCMAKMQEWSGHENANVRRLSSEGCRPRLPWGIALPSLKKDPSPVLPILDKLKDDPSESVRRSVANNLNDISKDNPDIVVGLVKKWKGKSENVDWVLKHGSRTLLKQAHKETLLLFGFGSAEKIKLSDFTIITPEVKIGEDLSFSFSLKNNDDKKVMIRLEYGLYYLKANRSHSKKVFKISEKYYSAGVLGNILRKQSFRIITTRTFYPGKHFLSIIINGEESKKLEFELEA